MVFCCLIKLGKCDLLTLSDKRTNTTLLPCPSQSSFYDPISKLLLQYPSQWTVSLSLGGRLISLKLYVRTTFGWKYLQEKFIHSFIFPSNNTSCSILLRGNENECKRMVTQWWKGQMGESRCHLRCKNKMGQTLKPT